MTFEQYTDAVLSALQYNPRQQDVIAKKQQILESVYNTENLTPTSVLFVGFTPAILTCQARTIAVTEISDVAQQFLKAQGVKFNYIKPADLSLFKKQFQAVIALDEYFTFASSDQEQQTKIAEICSLATDFVVSTIRDYKNQDFKDRDFSLPVGVRNGSNLRIFLESHDWDLKDRTRWNTMVYEIDDTDNSMKSYGLFERRTMFFKQLAKFSMDAGAVNFLVHKNVMYKGLLKKNYEHVVSIQFN
jgi:hypothetical protein